MTSLVTPAGRLDRRAVMIEAHRQFRLMRRYGWSFGRCLSFAWAKAREQREALSGSCSGERDRRAGPSHEVERSCAQRIASPIL